MKYQNIIVDTHNLFHRNYAIRLNKYKDSEKDIYQNTIKACMISIRKMERDFLERVGTIYFCFDNPESRTNLRSEISDEYKKNRKKMPDSFYRAVEKLKALLLVYKNNYRIVYVMDLEADDLVKPLLDYFLKRESALLYSNDLDWARLIDYEDRNIHWYNQKDVYNSKKFKEYYKFKPSIQSITIYKSITGDSIDCIPIGVKNIPKEAVYKLCEDFQDIYDIIFNVNKIDYLSDTFKKKIRDNERQLRINDKLVSFIDLKESTIEDNIYDCKFKEKALKLFYKTYGIDKSFDKRIKLDTIGKGMFKQEKLPRK